MTVLVGQTSAGTSTDFFGSGHTAAWPFTAAASGQGVLLVAQFKVANGSLSSCSIDVYADGAGGTSPGTQLATGAVSSGFTGTGQFSASVSAVTINSGTQYWLGIGATGEQVDLQGTTSSTGKESGIRDPSPWSNEVGGMGATPVIWLEDAAAVVLSPPRESLPFLKGAGGR